MFHFKIPKYIKLIFYLTLINFVMLWIRNLIVGEHVFHFLKSNLFSSFIPLVIAVLLSRFNNKINNFVFWITSFVWFIFYPNSPYMISDLIHNSLVPDTNTDPNMVIFDTLIVFSIAMLSVYYGFTSLKLMYSLFKIRYNKKIARISIGISLLCSGLGFYMGRILSSGMSLNGKPLWNGKFYSSEFFMDPLQVIEGTWSSLWPISENLNAYYMMILFVIVQCLVLVMMKDMSDIEITPATTKPDNK